MGRIPNTMAGVLVGDFEKNPYEVPRSCLFLFSPLRSSNRHLFDDITYPVIFGLGT